MTTNNQDSIHVIADLEFISRTSKACHEANKAFCESIGDFSQKPWEEASDMQKASTYAGVIAVIQEPEMTPERCHKLWLQEKVKAGWIYGKEKNEELRTHPCIVPYEKLPEEQQIKDEIFIAVVEEMLKTRSQ